VALSGECQSETRFRGVEVGIHCATSAAGGDVDVAFDDVRVTAR
jgi:hypothetical protein